LRYALRAVNVRRVVCGTNDGWYLGALGLGHHQRAPAAWSQGLVKQELRLVAALIASHGKPDETAAHVGSWGRYLLTDW
jgi:hypothetical protein